MIPTAGICLQRHLRRRGKAGLNAALYGVQALNEYGRGWFLAALISLNGGRWSEVLDFEIDVLVVFEKV